MATAVASAAHSFGCFVRRSRLIEDAGLHEVEHPIEWGAVRSPERELMVLAAALYVAGIGEVRGSPEECEVLYEQLELLLEDDERRQEHDAYMVDVHMMRMIEAKVLSGGDMKSFQGRKYRRLLAEYGPWYRERALLTERIRHALGRRQTLLCGVDAAPYMVPADELGGEERL